MMTDAESERRRALSAHLAHFEGRAAYYRRAIEELDAAVAAREKQEAERRVIDNEWEAAERAARKELQES